LSGKKEEETERRRKARSGARGEETKGEGKGRGEKRVEGEKRVPSYKFSLL
jgi:hypothetical protein